MYFKLAKLQNCKEMLSLYQLGKPKFAMNCEACGQVTAYGVGPLRHDVHSCHRFLFSISSMF